MNVYVVSSKHIMPEQQVRSLLIKQKLALH